MPALDFWVVTSMSRGEKTINAEVVVATSAQNAVAEVLHDAVSRGEVVLTPGTEFRAVKYDDMQVVVNAS